MLTPGMPACYIHTASTENNSFIVIGVDENLEKYHSRIFHTANDALDFAIMFLETRGRSDFREHTFDVTNGRFWRTYDHECMQELLADGECSNDWYNRDYDECMEEYFDDHVYHAV
jgi:hypothetical protein